MNDIASRDYGGRADLPVLIQFAGRCAAERFPLAPAWHPGDFIWELKSGYDAAQPIRLWLGDDGVEAVAWLFDSRELWFEARPRSDYLLTAAIAWARHRAAAASEDLKIRVFEADAERIAALARAGFRRTGPENVWFRLDLAMPHPAPSVPSGYRVRDSIGVEPAARAKAHRDAWNDLAHIGLPDARSSFTTEVYLSLRDAPGYDPALDILVEDQSGQFVANCICWADSHSRIGIFEPVGTHADFRGRGLARLAIAEGLKRLRGRGMTWARIGTAHFNKPAIAAYRGCGFELCDRTAWWAMALGAS